MVTEPCRPAANAPPRLFESAGQNKDGVDAAHFAVARDRLGALGAEFHERFAAGERAGEADGLDDRVLDELDPQIDAVVEEHGEDAFWQAAGFYAFADSLADQRAGAGMRGVGFDDDRVAGGESGGGVSPGY